VQFLKMRSIFKNTMPTFLASAVAWNLSKQTCGSLRNSVMLLDLDFMPSDQIGHMSLNGLRRRVATIDKTQTGTRMHEPSVALDPEYLVSTIGAPTLSFRRPKNNLLEYLQH
jgi:hypothetical protein